MKIGIFTDTYLPHISGVVTSIHMLRLGLEDLGHDVYIVTNALTAEEVEISNDPKIIRIPGVSVPIKQLSHFKTSSFLRRKMKNLDQYKFDVIHAHTEFSMGKFAYLYSKKKKTPLVYTFHTNYAEYMHYFLNPLTYWMKPVFKARLKRVLRWYVKYSDATITPTEKVASLLNSYKIKFNYSIIPTGIETSNFFEENVDMNAVQEIKDKYDLNNCFTFLYLGRVAVEKSIESLLEAFSKLPTDISAKFLIVGGGPHLPKVIAFAKGLGLEDKVIFTDMIEHKQVPNYYHASDVFLNASTSETQGLTYIEALSSNLPLIVKEDEATKELLFNDYNCLLYNTPEELKQAMMDILSNKEMSVKLTNNARESVRKYSKEYYAKSVEGLYTELISKPFRKKGFFKRNK